MSLALPFFAIFILCQIYAAVNDSRVMLIPNWISLVLLGAFVCVMPLAWESWGILGQHLLSGFGMFLLGFTMFALGWLGGGDAKLMAATAFWFVPNDLLRYIFITTLAGGGLALFLMAGRRYVPARILTSEWLYRMFKDETKMPYGIALAIGALMTLPHSHIYIRVLGL